MLAGRSGRYVTHAVCDSYVEEVRSYAISAFVCRPLCAFIASTTPNFLLSGRALGRLIQDIDGPGMCQSIES